MLLLPTTLQTHDPELAHNRLRCALPWIPALTSIGVEKAVGGWSKVVKPSRFARLYRWVEEGGCMGFGCAEVFRKVL